ncbi:MAG: hypothetical protein K2Q22_14425, partial [Cytophagales bacterium]|nr:hypothetical protein [Cytophagales bacterium]
MSFSVNLLGQNSIRSLGVSLNLISVSGTIPYASPCTSPTYPIGYNSYALNYTIDASQSGYKLDLNGDGVNDIEFLSTYKSMGFPSWRDSDGYLLEDGGFDYNIKITGNQQGKSIAFLDTKSFTGGNYISSYDTALFKAPFKFHIDVRRYLDCLPPWKSSVSYNNYGTSNINRLSIGNNLVIPFYYKDNNKIYFGKLTWPNSYPITPNPSLSIQTISGLPYFIYDADDSNNGNFLTNYFLNLAPYYTDFSN